MFKNKLFNSLNKINQNSLLKVPKSYFSNGGNNKVGRMFGYGALGLATGGLAFLTMRNMSIGANYSKQLLNTKESKKNTKNLNQTSFHKNDENYKINSYETTNKKSRNNLPICNYNYNNDGKWTRKMGRSNKYLPKYSTKSVKLLSLNLNHKLN